MRAEMKMERRDEGASEKETQQHKQERDDERGGRRRSMRKSVKAKGWDVMQATDTLTQGMSSQQAALSRRKVSHHANWTWRSLWSRCIPPPWLTNVSCSAGDASTINTAFSFTYEGVYSRASVIGLDYRAKVWLRSALYWNNVWQVKTRSSVWITGWKHRRVQTCLCFLIRQGQKRFRLRGGGWEIRLWLP